jgi:hypothetical protein
VWIIWTSLKRSNRLSKAFHDINCPWYMRKFGMRNLIKKFFFRNANPPFYRIKNLLGFSNQIETGVIKKNLNRIRNQPILCRKEGNLFGLLSFNTLNSLIISLRLGYLILLHLNYLAYYCGVWYSEKCWSSCHLTALHLTTNNDLTDMAVQN